ncbi:MAG: helix-turn-helix domain-containing protein, partial [Chloroflexota bacterium]|nr:helix-turn-helix domain-containing protein [Chloroflexota bacterium]
MRDSTATPRFGSLLRSLRLAARLTQEALAERSGVAARTVQDLERGIGHPRRDTVRRLVAVLRPDPDVRAQLEAGTSAPRARTRPSLRDDGQRPAGSRRGRPGAADSPAPASMARSTPLTSFVGREVELGDLTRLLPMTRLLTLTGPGGCGKTRLALELLPRVTSLFPEGLHFVSLAPLADPGLVASTIAEALGIREAPDQPVMESLRRGIGERRMLLVLDNFEHLLAAGPLLVDLLAACPRLTALVTSREVLRLNGEQVYPVPSLTLPNLANLPADAGQHLQVLS